MKIITFMLTELLLLLITLSMASAEFYSYGDRKTVIGNVRTLYEAGENDSLIEIARKFGLGYNEISDANPQIDPFLPGAGASVKIPTLWILPDVPSYEGIIINLSEMRLYYFFNQEGSRLVTTFPIGIGIEGSNTPVGQYKIIEKIVKPSWNVPESIRKEKPYLPKVVPPGPDNPLGSHALRLSLSNYLIHGTNLPWGIGRRVSHGCIRLYPEDIPKLFRLVSVGTKVNIVRQPLKLGIKGERVYVELHKDDEEENTNYFNEAVYLLRKKNLLKNVDSEKIYRAIKEKSGIPIKISN